MSITSTSACSSNGVRPPSTTLASTFAPLALVLAAGCPTRDAKPTPPAPAEPAPVAAPEAAAPDSAAPSAAAAEQVACDAGAECTSLGKLAFDQRRYVEAHQLFERACQLDDGLGCKWLALDLKDANDPRIAAAPERVAPTLDKACQLGELQACWLLGNGYLYGGRSGVTTPDPSRAIALYQKGCDGGEAGSCASLASCYADGEGVAKDKALAKKYRKRAAELGYVGE